MFHVGALYSKHWESLEHRTPNREEFGPEEKEDFMVQHFAAFEELVTCSVYVIFQNVSTDIHKINKDMYKLHS